MRYQLQQADLYAFANRQGIETRVRGNELQFKVCPYCHSSRNDRWSFSINMESGAFRCPRASCGRQGHFVELARDFTFQLQADDTETFKSLPTVPVTNKLPDGTAPSGAAPPANQEVSDIVPWDAVDFDLV